MKRYLRAVLALGLLFIPTVASAEVIMSEIAWMGTEANSKDEWIELYNTGNNSVELGDWTLVIGGEPIALSGAVGGGGFYLLVLDEGQTSVLGITADLSRSSGLSNGGEELILKNAADTVERLDFSDGWPAGNNDAKHTMQSSDGEWISGEATPKAENTTEDLGTGEEEMEENEDDSEVPADDETDHEISSHQGSVSIKDFDPLFEIIIEAGRDRIGVVGAPMYFEARAVSSEDKMITGGTDFSWTFGDGQDERGEAVEHGYQFPGTYEVVLHAEYEDWKAIDRLVVHVSRLGVVISDVQSGENGYVEISNNGMEEVNIGGYQLEEGNESFEFPKDTIIGPGKKIKFANAMIGIDFENDVQFVYPDEELIVKYEINGKEGGVGEVLGAQITSIEARLREARKKLSVLRKKQSGIQEVSRHFKIHFQRKDVSKHAKEKLGNKTKDRKDGLNEIPAKEQKKQVKEDEGGLEAVMIIREPESWWDKIRGVFF